MRLRSEVRKYSACTSVWHECISEDSGSSEFHEGIQGQPPQHEATMSPETLAAADMESPISTDNSTLAEGTSILPI